MGIKRCYSCGGLQEEPKNPEFEMAVCSCSVKQKKHKKRHDDLAALAEKIVRLHKDGKDPREIGQELKCGWALIVKVLKANGLWQTTEK